MEYPKALWISFLGIRGKYFRTSSGHNILCSLPCFKPIELNSADFYPQYVVYNSCRKQQLVARAHKKLLPPMNSHAITCSSDENETRGTKRPQADNKTLAGFIQAPRFHQTKDPARERADIPPGGARSWTSRQAGQAAG
jgi:hypothetical protein